MSDSGHQTPRPSVADRTGRDDLEEIACGDCGMPINPMEFHPWVFCLLWKNGVDDPEKHLSDLGFTREPKEARV